MEGVHNQRAPAGSESVSGPAGPGDSARLSRRQRWVLAQLGVPVWQLRPAADALRDAAPATAADAAAAARATPEPAPAENAAATAPRTSAAPRGEGAGDEIRVREAQARQASAPASTGPAAGRAAAPPQPRLDLVCLRQGNVLLLAPAATVSREEALVRDLMGAAGTLFGAAAGQPEEFRFFWPQPGSRGTPERALAAFIDKRLHDAGARLLLLCETATAWLPQPPTQALVLPALDALALDPQRKRAIWQELWQRQQTISR